MLLYSNCRELIFIYSFKKDTFACSMDVFHQHHHMQVSFISTKTIHYEKM